jgi:hypothetical protein
LLVLTVVSLAATAYVPPPVMLLKNLSTPLAWLCASLP